MTSTPPFKIVDDEAVVWAPYSAELRDALREHRPHRMELCGAWGDLGDFCGSVESVQFLRLSGNLKNGRVKSLRGLACFTGLKHLSLTSKVQEGIPSEIPQNLEKVELTWQPGVEDLLTLPTLRSACIHAYSYADLSQLPEGSPLVSLSLLTPRITSLAELARLRSLQTLSLIRARDLVRLSGLELSSILSLEIDEARKLNDFGAVAKSHTAHLRLIQICPTADLTPLTKCPSLVRLHVAGKGVPELPWSESVALPNIEFLAGNWDPDRHPVSLLKPADHRKIIAVEPVSGRGVRPLLVRLSLVQEGQENAA